MMLYTRSDKAAPAADVESYIEVSMYLEENRCISSLPSTSTSTCMHTGLLNKKPKSRRIIKNQQKSDHGSYHQKTQGKIL